MTRSEILRLGRLKEVLRFSARGLGLGSSMVRVMRDGESDESEAAKRILLGVPVAHAVSPMEGANDITNGLLLYVVRQSNTNASEASERGDSLSVLFERWIWMRQRRRMEQRVMETRSLLVSVVLGAVTAMASVLAPVLSSFQIALTPHIASPQPSYFGALFAVPGALFLGAFVAPKKAYVNALAAAVSFAAAYYFFVPLTSLP